VHHSADAEWFSATKRPSSYPQSDALYSNGDFHSAARNPNPEGLNCRICTLIEIGFQDRFHDELRQFQPTE
jgi:hypothetical protein